MLVLRRNPKIEQFKIVRLKADTNHRAGRFRALLFRVNAI
tara:strand:+ start:18835 stop:18954 length:120 start_codon:yes stop_codon:yes gene_type:complete